MVKREVIEGTYRFSETSFPNENSPETDEKKRKATACKATQSGEGEGKKKRNPGVSYTTQSLGFRLCGGREGMQGGTGFLLVNKSAGNIRIEAVRNPEEKFLPGGGEASYQKPVRTGNGLGSTISIVIS